MVNYVGSTPESQNPTYAFSRKHIIAVTDESGIPELALSIEYWIILGGRLEGSDV